MWRGSKKLNNKVPVKYPTISKTEAAFKKQERLRDKNLNTYIASAALLCLLTYFAFNIKACVMRKTFPEVCKNRGLEFSGNYRVEGFTYYVDCKKVESNELRGVLP